MTIVWSYGGGTQSVAMAVMILKGLLPRPDVIVMADTGREKQETWDYLSSVVRPAGFDVQIAPHSLATVDLYGTNGDLLIPAFTRQNGSVGKMPTFCSNEWKARVIQRWLRQQNINDCDVWLGMSTDEMERMKYSGLNWYRHVYPLVEIVPTSRHQCYSLVVNHGWPPPPKSSCWHCPNRSPFGWREMRDNSPADFQKAVNLEIDMQQKDPNVYLHELGKPLSEAVNESSRQSDMFDGCDSGYCETPPNTACTPTSGSATASAVLFAPQNKPSNQLVSVPPTCG